jgi:hypothetical protein
MRADRSGRRLLYFDLYGKHDLVELVFYCLEFGRSDVACAFDRVFADGLNKSVKKITAVGVCGDVQVLGALLAHSGILGRKVEKGNSIDSFLCGYTTRLGDVATLLCGHVGKDVVDELDTCKIGVWVLGAVVVRKGVAKTDIGKRGAVRLLNRCGEEESPVDIEGPTQGIAEADAVLVVAIVLS